MKNTIKLSLSEAMVIKTEGENVCIELTMFGAGVAKKTLDASTFGAVMFAMEQAGEAIEVARQNRRALEIAGQGGAS